jgi:hypothetical protein
VPTNTNEVQGQGHRHLRTSLCSWRYPRGFIYDPCARLAAVGGQTPTWDRHSGAQIRHGDKAVFMPPNTPLRSVPCVSPHPGPPHPISEPLTLSPAVLCERARSPPLLGRFAGCKPLKVCPNRPFFPFLPLSGPPACYQAWAPIPPIRVPCTPLRCAHSGCSLHYFGWREAGGP